VPTPHLPSLSLSFLNVAGRTSLGTWVVRSSLGKDDSNIWASVLRRCHSLHSVTIHAYSFPPILGYLLDALDSVPFLTTSSSYNFADFFRLIMGHWHWAYNFGGFLAPTDSHPFPLYFCIVRTFNTRKWYWKYCENLYRIPLLQVLYIHEALGQIWGCWMMMIGWKWGQFWHPPPPHCLLPYLIPIFSKQTQKSPTPTFSLPPPTSIYPTEMKSYRNSRQRTLIFRWETSIGDVSRKCTQAAQSGLLGDHQGTPIKHKKY
jgi:hypothetical protein